MQLKVILAGIILWHACFNVAISQGDEIRFSKVNGDNGEPLGKITAITQDAKGYMWFAGEGENAFTVTMARGFSPSDRTLWIPIH